MRLWSVHPRYLDRQGLLALWREGLLARAVLRGKTRGYRRHPQLERFRVHASPRRAISAYLAAVHAEAAMRGYAFDRSKIGAVRPVESMPVTVGQLRHEWAHLREKLGKRNPELAARHALVGMPECHPLFFAVPGPVEHWERRHDALERTASDETRSPDDE
ncbi:MAG: pyrimidine dimer DNA glycosylase/endonuclease V [Gammaproteobacteria bacterium]|nr:DNA lyase [Gammaproteobacteria bacterium]